MLLVAEVNKDIKILMTPEQEKLFGIEKLNVKRSKFPLLHMLTIQPEFKLFTKKQIHDIIN